MEVTMWKLLLSLLLIVPVMAAMTFGAEAGNEKELTDVYDAYNGFGKAGDVEKMLSLRTAGMVAEIRPQIEKNEDRDYFVIIGKGQATESYEVQHVEWTPDGEGARLYVLLHLPPMKEIQRKKKADMEASITFRKENGAWKLENVMPLADPSQIKRPKDLSYDQKDANTDRNGSIAGRIVKLEFRPDHTLIIVRVMDEEIAVFLPPKATLESANVNFDDLAPWKMREFTGFPHKTDGLKFFATGDRPME